MDLLWTESKFAKLGLQCLGDRHVWQVLQMLTLLHVFASLIASVHGLLHFTKITATFCPYFPGARITEITTEEDGHMTIEMEVDGE